MTAFDRNQPSRQPSRETDLGLGNPNLARARAGLVEQIRTIIDGQGLTQERAAELLGIEQPQVSTLLRSHGEGYSIDQLFHFLNALGQKVEITIRPKVEPPIVVRGERPQSLDELSVPPPLAQSDKKQPEEDDPNFVSAEEPVSVWQVIREVWAVIRGREDEAEKIIPRRKPPS